MREKGMDGPGASLPTVISRESGRELGRELDKELGRKLGKEAGRKSVRQNLILLDLFSYKKT